jgi:putative nucleotidyltransferase with HDIG domain
MAFSKAKDFIVKYFEYILVAILLLGLSFILFFVPQKLGFLNFYFLPVLAAGFVMGKRGGVLTALCSILFVTLALILFPQDFLRPAGKESLNLVLNLLPWGGFLILSAYTVGYLYEEKQKQMQDLKTAYIGVLEILSKLLESVDRYTEGHSVRVSELAMKIAIAMGLPRDEVENIRAAGLLHDIGKFEITTDLIRKAAELSNEEREAISQHTDIGAQIVSRIGPVLQRAVPIIMAHHEFFGSGIKATGHAKIPRGAHIVAVADAYDAMISDRPYRKGRPPWQAIEEIRKGAGAQFDPAVIEAFERVSAEFISQER